MCAGYDGRLLGVLSWRGSQLTLYKAPSSCCGENGLGVRSGKSLQASRVGGRGDEGEGGVRDAILCGSDRSRVTPGILASEIGGGEVVS